MSKKISAAQKKRSQTQDGYGLQDLETHPGPPGKIVKFFL